MCLICGISASSLFSDLAGWVRIQFAAPSGIFPFPSVSFAYGCCNQVPQSEHLTRGIYYCEVWKLEVWNQNRARVMFLKSMGSHPPCLFSSVVYQWFWASVVWTCRFLSLRSWLALVSSIQHHLWAHLCPSLTLSIGTPVRLGWKPLLQYDVTLIITSTMGLFPNKITSWETSG